MSWFLLNRNLTPLEPYDWKLSRTVLRGERGSNAPDLPGTERLREFPLEFKIWDDCLRTGKFPVISSTEKGKVTYVDLVGAKNASGATFKSSDLLWPISLNEMQRNPSLTQNEGYAVQ